MKRACLLLFGVVLVTVSRAFSAGLAHNENFIVLAPDQPLAEIVLAQADDFRRTVALDWFGAELETGKDPTMVHVELSTARDAGLTWPIDSPDRKYHTVWLTTSADRAVGSTLHHEIAHIVLATRFRNRLPWWAEEGIASQYDDAERKQTRQRLLAQFAQSGKWPSIDAILEGRIFAPDDEPAYAIAVSITDFLLTQGDRNTFLALAADGPSKGWPTALREHYGLASFDVLEARWKAWLRRGPTAQVAHNAQGGSRSTARGLPPLR